MNPCHVSVELVLPNELTEVRRVQDGIAADLQANQWDITDVFAIKLAVEEALVNAIKHGNQFDPDKKVRVSYTMDDERFEIVIDDELTAPLGRPFRRVWLRAVAPDRPTP